MRHHAMAAALLVGCVLATGVAQDAMRTSSRITVAVDPRVELMSLVFRLAGNPEYNQANSASPYADEIESRFGRFRRHRVVGAARAMRREHGVSYDAVMSMAVHLGDTETLAERVSFATPPDRLDPRWSPEDTQRFLDALRDFVRASAFNDFVAEHADFYDACAARLRAPIEARDYVSWFDGYFGARADATFTAIPGLLNGGGNYGIGIRFEDGREEITPVLGVHEFDDDGLPVFGDGIASTIVHELCHSYTNPIVDAYADRLEPSGRVLFATVAVAMRRQAYGNWKTMMYESLVRACTVRNALVVDGPGAAARAAAYHRQRGFRWIEELSARLGEYEARRDEFATLDAFMPRIVDFFNAYAADVDARADDVPRIVSMTPRNGATDVDPALAAITVVFDRPMAPGAWSVVGGGAEFPETTAPPSYDAEHLVFTLPVRLKPGWTYRFGLNSERFTAFKSRAGVPLEPVAVTFTTRDE